MNKLPWIQNKILTLEELSRKCHTWRHKNDKIVFTNGCFDILHFGHLQLLAKAASFGNKLIIGLNSDSSVKKLKGNDRPINHEQDRLFQLASLLVVDAVCLFEEDTPLELIKHIQPNVLVKGGDYTVDTIVGADVVTGYGGSVEIIPFVDGYSTSNTIEQIKKL